MKAPAKGGRGRSRAKEEVAAPGRERQHQDVEDEEAVGTERANEGSGEEGVDERLAEVELVARRVGEGHEPDERERAGEPPFAAGFLEEDPVRALREERPVALEILAFERQVAVVGEAQGPGGVRSFVALQAVAFEGVDRQGRRQQDGEDDRRDHRVGTAPERLGCGRGRVHARLSGLLHGGLVCHGFAESSVTVDGRCRLSAVYRRRVSRNDRSASRTPLRWVRRDTSCRMRYRRSIRRTNAPMS